jgi:hypothetical protein
VSEMMPLAVGVVIMDRAVELAGGSFPMGHAFALRQCADGGMEAMGDTGQWYRLSGEDGSKHAYGLAVEDRRDGASG